MGREVEVAVFSFFSSSYTGLSSSHFRSHAYGTAHRTMVAIVEEHMHNRKKRKGKRKTLGRKGGEEERGGERKKEEVPLWQSSTAKHA